MKIYKLLIPLLFCPILSIAQESSIRIPKFPDDRYQGGAPAFYEQLGKNFKYPTNARRGGIIGTAILAFTLTPEGEVKDIEMANPMGKEIDKMVKRVFSKTTKKFLPDEKAFSLRIYLPITFIIDGAHLLQVPMDENLFVEPIRVVAYSSPAAAPGVTPRDKLIDKMYKAMEKRKHKSALVYINELIRRDPFNKQWYITQSGIHKEMGNRSGVCESLQQMQDLLRQAVSQELLAEYCD